MPPRSNEFQRLIVMITELLGDGTAVTESKMLRELNSDQLREVDICIESTIAGQPVTIGIECRDHSRKQGVEFVETMVGKHLALPTNVLILVSSSGFTDTALAKARQANVKAIAPSQVNDELATDIAAQLGLLQVAAMTLEVVSADLTIGWPDEWAGEELPEVTDVPMFRADGSPLARLQQFEMQLLIKHCAATPDAWMRPGTPAEFDIDVQVAEPRHDGEVPYFSVYLTDTPLAEADPHPRRLLPLQHITVHGKARITRTDPKLTTKGDYNGTTFYTGTSVAGAGTSQYVVVETPDGLKGAVTFEVDGLRRPKNKAKEVRSHLGPGSTKAR